MTDFNNKKTSLPASLDEELFNGLLTIANKDPSEIVNFFDEVCHKLNLKKDLMIHRSKKLTSPLITAFGKMADTDFSNLWAHLNTLVNEVLSNLSTIEDRNEIFLNGLRFLNVISFLCYCALSKNPFTSTLTSVVSALHANFFDLCGESVSFACNTSTLCLEYYQKDLPLKRKLFIKPVCYLLVQVTLPKNIPKEALTVKAMVELVYLTKEDLPLFLIKSSEVVFDDIYIRLANLIVACAITPEFLVNKHGRKILAMCLSQADQEVVDSLHSTVFELLTNKQTHAHIENLGSVYQQAWLLADDDRKMYLERNCFQDLMYKAIKTPRGKTTTHRCLFNQIRILLRNMLVNKSSKYFKYLPSRLYDPFIWRSIECINCSARSNALLLLFDVFPLRDEKFDPGEQENYLRKQIKAIEGLLADPNPQTRCLAISCSFSLLSLYWDLISPMASGILNIAFSLSTLTDKLDDIRDAVIKGVIVLLQCPTANDFLVKNLHKISPMINDPSEKIRVAFADMLLKIKETDGIMFWHVCNVPDIWTQIHMDKTSVSKRLCKLLISSYMPADKPDTQLVRRCIHFFKTNPTSARKFYIIAATEHDLKEIERLISGAVRFVYHKIRFLISKNHSIKAEEPTSDSEKDELDDEPEDDKENVSTSLSEDPTDDRETLVTICGLLEAVAVLWPAYTNRCKATPQNVNEGYKQCSGELSKTLRKCFKYDEWNSRYIQVLNELASVVDPRYLNSYSRTIIPKLKSLPSDSPKEVYTMFLRCSFRWRWGNQVLELIADWLEVPEDLEAPTRRSSRTKKRVHFAGLPASRPDQALKYLSCILDSMNLSYSKLSVCTDGLRRISKLLKNSTDELLLRLKCGKRKLPNWTETSLLEALRLRFEVLGNAHVAYNRKNQRRGSISSARSQPYLSDLQQLFQLLIEDLFQLKSYLDQSFLQDLDTSSQDVNTRQMSQKLLKKCLTIVLKQITFFYQCSIRLHKTSIELIYQITSSSSLFGEFISPASQLLYEVIRVYLSKDYKNSSDSHASSSEDFEKIPNIIHLIFVELRKHRQQDSYSFERLVKSGLRRNLKDTIKLVTKYRAFDLQNLHVKFLQEIVFSILIDFIKSSPSSYPNSRDDFSCFGSHMFFLLVDHLDFIKTEVMPNLDKNLILELSEEEKTEHLDEAIQAFILCLTKKPERPKKGGKKKKPLMEDSQDFLSQELQES